MNPPEPQTLEEANAIIQAQRKIIETLQQQNAELEKRVLALEALVKQNSSNSSRPPSSDPPGTPPPSKPKSSGRKRGGQPGHDRNERELIPVEAVDRVVPLKPKQCRKCDRMLRGSDPSPYRHQVFDVPPVKAMVDEISFIRCAATIARR